MRRAEVDAQRRIVSDLTLDLFLLWVLCYLSILCYDLPMTGLRVYIWKGQTRAISKFLRENRARCAAALRSGETIPQPVTDRSRLILDAFGRWVRDDCPPLDWCRMLYLPSGAWAPTVKDSIRITIPTEDPEMLDFVQTLAENRAWLGRGCRISQAVPARATLAIVHAYMLSLGRRHNEVPVYPHPITPDAHIHAGSHYAPRLDIMESIWEAATPRISTD